MISFRKIFIYIFLFFLSSFGLLFTSFADAQADKGTTTVAVFVRQGCAHCKAEEEYLRKLSDEVKTVGLKYYRLESSDSRKLWEQFTNNLQIAKVTPITVIGNKYIIGFDNEQTTGKEIRKLITEMQSSKTLTDLNNKKMTAAGQQQSTCAEDKSIPCAVNRKSTYVISLPVLGSIDTAKYPLFFLSALLGFFDGFNPCAMWVLVTFLLILLQVGDRRKMFLFAGIFILAEAIMYTLILTVWYKTWDFVRLDGIVTPVIGLVSIAGGIFFLREWRKKEIACKVTNIHERAKTTSKIKKMASDKFTVFTFLGILGIAFSVNIVEFACSIGIPQAFTKILELNRLPFLEWFSMIATYILFYMIDDLFVFALAFWGADHMGITTKYSKQSNLLGGIVMIILGLIMMYNSRLLLF